MADDLDDEWWKEGSEASASEEGDVELPSDTERDSKPQTEEPGPEQNAKKKKKKRKKKTITAELAKTGELAASKEDLTDFLQKQFKEKLTPVEWDELKIDTDKTLFPTNSVTGFPSAYLKGILPKWKKIKAQPFGKGSPALIVVSSSALRAVQLNRQIQDFKGTDCKCAKLFAKHMKLDEQQKYLKKTVCHLGVGTPNRIHALLKSGHLQLEKVSAFVIDWNWRDVKKRRLVDIPEIRTELAVLLKSFIIPHIKSHTSCKIGIL